VSLARTQTAMARLFTDSAARAELMQDPAGRLPDGVAAQDAVGLAAEIERYAKALIAKRRLDVAKWLPLSAKALGADFGDRMREALVEPPPGARADALALVARLQSAREPAWIGELAAYEGEFLRAWGPRARLAVRRFRWPVPRIAERLAANAAIADIGPAPTLAVWARAPHGRLWHRWWTPPGAAIGG
jgi:hypothetical protein